MLFTKNFFKILSVIFAMQLIGQRSFSQIAILEDSTLQLSSVDALKLFQAEEAHTLMEDGRFNPGFTNSIFWLLLKSDSLEQEKRLIVGNAHINKIEFYKANITTLQTELIYLTGDHFPFHQRPFPNRLFVFPIEASDSNTVWLLKIDKHHESLQLTANLYGLDEYYDKSSIGTLINGALTGVMALILFLGAFLFINTRNSLYAYYMLYLLLAWLWVFADKGYGFQFLWPDSSYFATRSRPFFYSLSCLALLQFMRAFINQTRQSPLYKWVNWALIWFGLQASLALLDIYQFNNSLALMVYLMIVTPSGLAAMALLVLSIWEKIREGSLLAKYYLLSVSVFVGFSILEILSHGGIWLPSNYYLSNFGIHTGLILEAIILLYGLASQFNNYRKEREQLLVDINKKQEETTIKVFEAQEIERKKIADQLHDEVGSLLSVVSLNISSVLEKHQEHPKTQTKLQSAFEAIGSAATLVRNISHILTPIAIEKYGFKRAIDNLIRSINTSEKLKIECVVIGFEQTEQYSVVMLNDIFRSIQEMLSNTIKHSGASHAYVELIEHEDAISLMVEDNGRGVPNIAELKRGNGLDNIFSRISYFKGTIEINSSPETGTLIVIEIPTNKN